MKVTIASGQAKGAIMAPPSKSMAHRMLICAGLADGQSTIKNIALSEDVKATLGILRALGGEYTIENQTIVMNGVGKKALCTEEILDSKESGSTLRFFIPLVLCGGKKAVFTGAQRLFERPLSVYETICKEQGITFAKKENGLCVEGQLCASHFQIPGDISSQFVTGLLFALPLLNGDSVLEVLPPVESQAYIDMTLDALECFGVEVQRNGYTFSMKGNQTYRATDVTVEGDYSNAAFLEALNLAGGDVVVDGLWDKSLQGDRVYREYFTALKEGHARLDISECPDLGPILMSVAAMCNGATLTGTRRLKMKESDRGTVMAEELKKFGIRVDVKENEIEVYPGTLQKPVQILKGHNDHRIVMSLATLCVITGGVIEGAEAVAKSFPDYFEMLEKLGICVTSEM